MTLSILTVNTNKGKKSNLECYQSALIKKLRSYLVDALVHSSGFHASAGDVGAEVVLLLRKGDTQFYIWQQATEKHRFEWASLEAPRQAKVRLEERDSTDPEIIEQVDRALNACEAKILPGMLEELKSAPEVLSVEARLMFKNSQFTWARVNKEMKFS